MRPDVFVTSANSYFMYKNLSTDLLTVSKRLSALGGLAPWPTTTGSAPGRPRWGLAPDPVIGSRSHARHVLVPKPENQSSPMVACGLTAKKPGSAACPTLVIEYGTSLLCGLRCHYLHDCLCCIDCALVTVADVRACLVAIVPSNALTRSAGVQMGMHPRPIII